MQFKTKMIIPMAAITLAAAGLYGAAQVSAAADTTNPQASLIQKLADTLKVDKSKVQAVFDQDRTERQAARETQHEARLAQAVADGEITSAQKDLILAEHKKLKAQMEATRTAAADQTQAERRAAMEKIHDDAEAWAKANNIDAKWLMGGRGLGGHEGMGGHGRMMGHGPAGDAS